jgi:hypothetical protein
MAFNTLNISSKLFIVAGALAACQIQAAPLAIINPSFEFVDSTGCSGNNKLTAGSGNFIDSGQQYVAGCVDATPFGNVAGSSGWSVSGPDAGALAPATLQYNPLSRIPDGTTVAFINTGSIFQVLSSTLQAGTYSLSVFIGSRNDGAPLGPYTVELLAGSTVIASDSNDLTVPVNSFVKDTNPGLTVNILPGDPNLGAHLEILFSASEPGGGPPALPTNQADFDQVTLDFQPAQSSVPEPGSMFLCSAGAAAILLRALHRRRLGKQ